MIIEQCCTRIPVPTEKAHHDLIKPFMRTSSLGYDRYGFEYWLLNAQQHYALLSHLSTAGNNNNIVASGANNVPSDDILLLLRDAKNGIWYYYSDEHLEEVVRHLDPSLVYEKFLRDNLVLSILRAKFEFMNGRKVIQKTQSELLQYALRAEKWIQNISTNFMLRLSPKDKVKALELIHARCIEVRLNIHYANIRMLYPNLSELDMGRTDRERKRIRDNQLEDSLDVHTVHGWHRADAFNNMRMLSTTTFATRLYNDVTLYQTFGLIMKKCRFRFRKYGNSTSIIIPLLQLPIDVELEIADTEKVLGGEDGIRYTPMDGGGMPMDGEEEEEADEEEGLGEYGNRRSLSQMRRMSGKSQRLSSSFHRPARVKPVEQLCLATGAVLRRYASGTDAAAAMQASQSGISLCCKGLKPDAFGFKWRFFEGERCYVLLSN